MKRIHAMALTALAALSIANGLDAVQIKNKAKRNLTPEERAARRAETEREIYEWTGGILKRPGTQKGCIVYVNAQKRAPMAWIDESAAYMRKKMRVEVRVKEGKFALGNVKREGDVSLFIVDDETLPMSFVAPEERWGMVNIAKLWDARPQFFEARVKKELARGFSITSGCYVSSYENILMSGISGAEGLDRAPNWELPVDVVKCSLRALEGFGVTPYQPVSYRKAIMEGWAPAPTNDVQKAIWDKVHEMPTEPIKIKPETKKVAN